MATSTYPSCKRPVFLFVPRSSLSGYFISVRNVQLLKVQGGVWRRPLPLCQVLLHTKSHVKASTYGGLYLKQYMFIRVFYSVWILLKGETAPLLPSSGAVEPGIYHTIHVHRVPHSVAKAAITTCVKRSDFRDVDGKTRKTRNKKQRKHKSPKLGRRVCVCVFPERATKLTWHNLWRPNVATGSQSPVFPNLKLAVRGVSYWYHRHLAEQELSRNAVLPRTRPPPYPGWLMSDSTGPASHRATASKCGAAAAAAPPPHSPSVTSSTLICSSAAARTSWTGDRIAVSVSTRASFSPCWTWPDGGPERAPWSAALMPAVLVSRNPEKEIQSTQPQQQAAGEERRATGRRPKRANAWKPGGGASHQEAHFAVRFGPRVFFEWCFRFEGDCGALLRKGGIAQLHRQTLNLCQNFYVKTEKFSR